MDCFREDAPKQMQELACKMKQTFRDEIAKEFANNYFKENKEKKMIDFQSEIMEKIGNEIIDKYYSDFIQTVNRFISIDRKFKLNNTIKKVKIGMAIGGSILVIGGGVAACVAFPLAPAVATVITVMGYEAAAFPFISGVTVAVSGVAASVTGLSAYFSKKKNLDSSNEKFSFRVIPPEEFVKEKIKFKLFIGQVTYPLKSPND